LDFFCEKFGLFSLCPIWQYQTLGNFLATALAEADFLLSE